MGGYVMDTTAWIEYFRASQTGEHVQEYIFPRITEEGRESADIITPTIVVMELKSYYIRQDEEDKFYDDLAVIRELSSIKTVNIDEPLAIKVGEKHGHEHTTDTKIGYNDCILITLAEKMNRKVISTDKHFEGSPHTIYIKQVKEGNNEN